MRYYSDTTMLTAHAHKNFICGEIVSNVENELDAHNTAIQYSARRARLLYTSCLLPTFDEAVCHVMVTGWLRLNDVSVICRVVNPHPTCPKNGNTFRVQTVLASGMTLN